MFTKRALVWGSLVFAMLGFAALGQVSASSNGYPDIKISKLIIMPSNTGHVDWTDAIRHAKKTIHMTMYHLTDKTVINALIARANDSGLDMRILVDGKSLKGGYAAAINELKDAGVQVRGSTPGFDLTHSKDMVIDGKEAFIGAIDLTNTATKMRDFAIVTPDSSIISEVEKVFETDWAQANTHGASTPNVSNSNLVWSPTNSDSRLVSLIDSATSSIDAETENFDNSDIIAAFNRATQRGVAVRLITPECSFGNAQLNYQGFAQLQGGSVHVEHDGASIAQPYMHSKMMVIDGKTVYVGSINLSFNSIQNDRELGVIFSDAKTAGSLSSEFETDWNRSQIPSANPNCPSSIPFIQE